MDFKTIFFALYETSLSVVFGLLTVFIVYKTLDKIVLRSNTVNEIKKGNIAVALFYGVIIVCVLLLVLPSILSSVNALRAMVLGSTKLKLKMVIISLGYFLAFYIISIVMSLVIILLTSSIYMKATRKIDEVQELSQNNIALSIILSLIMLGLTIFIRPSVDRLIHSLVNYEMIDKKIMEMEEVEDYSNAESVIVPEE
ncbi:MAG: DUF350 domain-containing protein [Planctomycetota bacterium]|jgi:uncharacterized membrane protein YjfL (UPF0719 family)